MKIFTKSMISFLLISSIIILNIVASISAQNDFAYTVMPGDTIYKIAEMFDANPETIIEINKISTPSIIIPGQVIIIPRGDDSKVPAASAIATAPPIIVSSSSTPSLPPTEAPATNPILITQSPLVAASATPSPMSSPIAPSPTVVSFVNKAIGSPSEMNISMNFVNCDTKLALQALALSMDKKIIMLQEPKQKTLNFKADNTPLLTVMDLILKNENASSKDLGSTIIIEALK